MRARAAWRWACTRRSSPSGTKVGLLEPVLRLARDTVRAHEERRRRLVTVAGVCGSTARRAEAELARSIGYDLGAAQPGSAARRGPRGARSPHAAGWRSDPALRVLPPAGGGRKRVLTTPSGAPCWRSERAIKVAPFNRYQTLDVARAADSGRAVVLNRQRRQHRRRPADAPSGGVRSTAASSASGRCGRAARWTCSAGRARRAGREPESRSCSRGRAATDATPRSSTPPTASRLHRGIHEVSRPGAARRAVVPRSARRPLPGSFERSRACAHTRAGGRRLRGPESGPMAG